MKITWKGFSLTTIAAAVFSKSLLVQAEVLAPLVLMGPAGFTALQGGKYNWLASVNKTLSVNSVNKIRFFQIISAIAGGGETRG